MIPPVREKRGDSFGEAKEGLSWSCASGSTAATGGSEGRAGTDSGKKAGSSGRYPAYPHFHEEADQNSRFAPILHDVENLGQWMVKVGRGHYHRVDEDLYDI